MAALLLSVLPLGAAMAAGSPINEDYTAIIKLSQQALESAKQGNADAFVKAVGEAQSLAKEQNSTGNSVTLGRVGGKFRAAVGAAKAGNLTEGGQAVEAALAELTKKKGPIGRAEGTQ
ncbi:hypothetical protein [Methylogaea oryzae]|uniref:hypothetical protein n=1 Tax=Methylogaea oryzae TaxID=1295382 RepID=UPI001C3F3151|nr:hypothetical protein [Methylogaea oryzae]